MTTRNDAKYAALDATYNGSLADMRDQWDAAQTFMPTEQDGQYALFGGATYVDGESGYWEGGLAPQYESWSGPGWFDASDATTITTSGGVVTAIANRRAGGGDLICGGSTGRTVVSGAQGGKQAILITSDITTSANVVRAVASSISPVSQVFQGDDKPFIVISVYVPLQDTAGVIWSASDTTGSAAGAAQIVGLISRNTTSSIRRQVSTTTTNDVSWTGAQIAPAPRIVAVKHTGTAISVWDNSTTKIINGTAQNANPLNTELVFMLWASETNGSTDPTYLLAQRSMYWCETIVESAPKSDAEIQQAIVDLAFKWGITLS